MEDLENIRQRATGDLVDAWYHYDTLYRQILDSVADTPGWYADYLLARRDMYDAELRRRKRQKLAEAWQFESSTSWIDKEHVRSLNDIVDVIAETTELKRAGKQKYRGRCPLHGGENRSSLSVDAEKQLWKCHSCQRGGDVFAWIEELRGVEFAEAIAILAERAGLERQEPARPAGNSKRDIANSPEPQKPEIISLV